MEAARGTEVIREVFFGKEFLWDSAPRTGEGYGSTRKPTLLLRAPDGVTT